MAHGYLFRHWPGLGSRRSLAARGRFLNTFGGLGFCVALLLLAAGGYLIEQQSENSVRDRSAGLLVAAVLITTGASPLYCLLHSSWKLRRDVPLWPAAWEDNTIAIVRRNVRASVGIQVDLPLHGRFVDRTVIRIQN